MSDHKRQHDYGELRKSDGSVARTLRVYGEVNESDIAAIKLGQYDWLFLYLSDYSQVDLRELNPSLSALTMTASKAADISWLSEMDSLESVFISGKIKGCVSLEGMVSLRSLSTPSDKPFLDLYDEDVSLPPLQMLGVPTPSKPFSEFSSAIKMSVTNFALRGGNLASLSGISQFKKLKSLGLMDLYQLKDISDLSKVQSLIEFDVDACNRIEDLSCIGQLTQLRRLVLQIRKIPTLYEFLPGSCLETVRLGDQTHIEDKDTSAFLLFPNLSKVMYPNRRGYQFSSLEINERLDRRRI